MQLMPFYCCPPASDRHSAVFQGVSMLYVMLFYGSEPVARLPAAALFPLGYLLAMPGCPSGCVSATSWVIISGSVVRRAVTAVTGR